MNWKVLIGILLLLPTWDWCGLPLVSSPVEIAEHYAIEGEHTSGFPDCPSPVIDQPQVLVQFDIPDDEPAYQEQLMALLPHPHLARDHPPPLFYSLSHSLRAPPTLMLA